MSRAWDKARVRVKYSVMGASRLVLRLQREYGPDMRERAILKDRFMIRCG